MERNRLSLALRYKHIYLYSKLSLSSAYTIGNAYVSLFVNLFDERDGVIKYWTV